MFALYMFCNIVILSSIKMSSNTKYFAILDLTVGVSAVDEMNQHIYANIDF